ncbi:MAG: HD domain-containing protein [Sulfolobales archaeon]
MGCYAYKDEETEETLAKHILDISNCIKNLWETEGLSSKLSKIYGVDKLVAYDMLIVAGIIHDMGKTQRVLQEECSKKCTSFRLHYITSAQLALKLGYDIPELGLSPNNIEAKLEDLLSNKEIKLLDHGDLYILIVVLPTLLHHYSQITSESSILSGLDSQIKVLCIHEDCIKDLTLAMSNASCLLKSELGSKLLERLMQEVKKGSVNLRIIIGGQAFRNVSGNYEYSLGRFIVEAAMGILNLCDGMVAFTNRRPFTARRGISKEFLGNVTLVKDVLS